MIRIEAKHHIIEGNNNFGFHLISYVTKKMRKQIQDFA